MHSDGQCRMHNAVGHNLEMRSPNERLREVRALRYPTATAAAHALGIVPSTYMGHENGNRGFPKAAAIRYAKFFRVSLRWLLEETGPRERDGRVADELEELSPEAQAQALAFIEFLKAQPPKR